MAAYPEALTQNQINCYSRRPYIIAGLTDDECETIDVVQQVDYMLSYSLSKNFHFLPIFKVHNAGYIIMFTTSNTSVEKYWKTSYNQ